MMTEACRGQIDRADPRELAIALAGALAELGVVRIEMRAGDSSRALEARRTDLPGVLLGALERGSVELRDPNLGIEIVIEGRRCQWRSADDDAASALRALDCR